MIGYLELKHEYQSDQISLTFSIVTEKNSIYQAYLPSSWNAVVKI